MKFIPILLIASVLFISGCTSQSSQTTGYTADNLPSGIPATGEEQLTPPGNDVGNKAPDFTVTATDGRTIRLSELTAEKKPVALYFTATWCPFCAQEYETLKKVYPQYQDKVELLSVSLDLTENRDILERYRVSRGQPGTFAPGNQKILIDYDVVSTTTKYAISRDGVILYRGSGALSASNWKIIFEALAEN